MIVGDDVLKNAFYTQYGAYIPQFIADDPLPIGGGTFNPRGLDVEFISSNITERSDREYKVHADFVSENLAAVSVPPKIYRWFNEGVFIAETPDGIGSAAAHELLQTLVGWLQYVAVIPNIANVIQTETKNPDSGAYMLRYNVTWDNVGTDPR